MFCLRSWLPLLFIPTNAPPVFVFLFFVCTFFLSRPCVYCSFLLVILFLTSCHWADRCFFDFSHNWFIPRPPIDGSGAGSCLYGCPTVDVVATTPAGVDSAPDFNATVMQMANSTAGVLGKVILDEAMRKRAEWTGLGMEWMRSLLGEREWRVDFLDIYIRL
ncbi:hypothetical protein TD95_005221 [Thielaviopsis punctulata]|uniref:Uncharacterized protein n=1 Tax=Thielaviopsis punctulata TaxID=72032 RepID=A0A0F4Z8W0_9PEZI|nr:hypothetical protein TD95_005221 [Thielaviopsis punctulata]